MWKMEYEILKELPLKFETPEWDYKYKIRIVKDKEGKIYVSIKDEVTGSEVVILPEVLEKALEEIRKK